MMKKRGSILYFVILLVTAMIILSFGLTKQMSSHTQLITLNDYTQTARYFLESYVSDVIQHIRKEANNPGSNIYDELRGTRPTQNGLLTLNYSLSDELKKIESGSFLSTGENISLAPDAKIAHDGDPEAKIVGNQEELQSNSFTYGNVKEYKGLIEITCKCKFREKKYTLIVNTPYTVVYRMLPVLKDFQLFVDNFSKEQGNDKIKDNDKINTMFSYNGYYNEIDCSEFQDRIRNIKSRPASYDITSKRRPFILLSLNKDTADNSDELDYGQVFLGSSDDNIFLNLSGGKVYNADNAVNNYMPATEVDLMCLPSFMGFQKGVDFEGEDKFIRKGFIDKPGGGQIEAPLIMIPMQYNIKVKYSLQGFSHEIVDSLDNLESTSYKFDDFLKDQKNGDFAEFVKKVDRDYFYYSLSSGLKLFGYVPEFIAQQDGAQARPGKRIYGNVYGRYFILSIAQHGLYPGRPLKYSSTYYNINDMRGFETYTTSESGNRIIPIKFPNNSQLDYNKVMSRMMSGSKAVVDDPNLFMPMNYDSDTGVNSVLKSDANKLSCKDGTKNKIKLDEYGKNYLDLNKEKSINDRIGRRFDSQEEFEDEVGLSDNSNKSFQINGVVYVKGKLDLSNKLEGIKNKNIGGGIIIVEEEITLGNIDRGEDLYSKKITFSPDYVNSQAFKLHENWIKGGTGPNAEFKLTQDKVLTFVSLSKNNNAITIKGNALIGVQLVALNGKDGDVKTQIKWDPDDKKEIIFLGGIACNYLNIDETVKDFGKIKDTAQCKVFHAPFFMYHPDMATSTPSLAVQIPQNLASYKLYSSKD